MRRIFSTRVFARSAGLGLAALLAVTLNISCNDDGERNGVRDEYIRVYSNPFNSEPSEAIVFSVGGGEQTVYVRSNIDFTARWENSGTDKWATVIDDNGTDSRTGCRTITLSVDPISASSVLYTKRSGTLALIPTDPTLNYNVYVTCNQGSEQRIGTDFSWLSYGSADPNSLDGTLMDEWTTAQKNYNWSSTVIAGEEQAYCYGRRGYIQLGDDDGHGADLITPTTSALYEDTLLVVSFNAVAYINSRTGRQDGNKLVVEVTGGGVIQDYADRNGTSIQFAVPYYNLDDEDFPDTMWEGTQYLVFVKSTEASPINAATHIRFISGSLTEVGAAANRVFLDNIYVYSVGADEEDYFTENGGSGLDFILGKQ